MRILAKFWYRILFFLIRKIYFRDISIINADNIDDYNFYLLLTKNDAVDGFIYEKFIPDIKSLTFFHSQKNFVSKMFFLMLNIDRKNDGKTDKNSTTNDIESAVNVLKDGESFAVFLGGSSTKYTEKNDYELIIKQYEKHKGKPLKIMVMGIHYDNPMAMGGNVEIVARKVSGNEYETVLEEVGVNFKSKKDYEKAKKIAVVSSLDGKNSYFKALKYCEKNADLFKDIDEYERMTKGLFKFKEITVFPIRKYVSILAVISTLPFVVFAFLSNILPLTMGYLGSILFSDGKKDISLWKIIVGSLCFIPWIIFIGVFYGIKIFPLYLVFSYLGFRFYGMFKKHIIAVINLILEPELREDFIDLKRIIDEKID